MDTIQGFINEYRWLSNFYPSPIKFNGYLWPTVEHAYVAHKVEPRQYPRVAQHVLELTAGQAKRYGRSLVLRDCFDDIKFNLMYRLQMLKYLQNSGLAEKLRATDKMHIEETNDWHDNFWGVCTCEKCQGLGRNHLGKIIMSIRSIV